MNFSVTTGNGTTRQFAGIHYIFPQFIIEGMLWLVSCCRPT